MDSTILSTEAISAIIGLKSKVPTTPGEMARSLKVAFYPSPDIDEKLKTFLVLIETILRGAGVTVISYNDALREGHHGHVGRGIVLIAAGEGESGNLAIDHVSSLTENTVIGIFYRRMPGFGQTRFQQRVDSIVHALVWHMVHIIIYVDDETWTVCTMNGAIDTFSLSQLEDRVVKALIPKIAAPVRPPQKRDYTTEFDAFDPFALEYQASVCEMLVGANLWGESGLLASQTKLDDLSYRNNKYRRIAAAYLSYRTGMSYGFLARQLPLAVTPAIRVEEAHKLLQYIAWEEKDFIELDDQIVIAPKICNVRYLVRVPPVTVLCTRSGCEKTKINPHKDLVILRLSKGRVSLGLAKHLPEGSDCQPSFDTLIILAHAVGNSIIANLLARIIRNSKFGLALRHQGLAMVHWHGMIDQSCLPPGYYLHGNDNPPVSCSTPQAAIYALVGKLASFETSILENVEYAGDAHVEPSHGTNFCGSSMKELSRIVGGNQSGHSIAKAL